MKKIAIYGSECTGKTTLAEMLAEQYQTVWVSEFVRDYALVKPDIDLTDVVPIIEGQIKREEDGIEQALKLNRDIIFCDTIPLSSIVYSIYYGYFKKESIPDQVMKLYNRNYDLYFLTDIDVPWEADVVRDEGVDRVFMHSLFLDALNERNISFTLLSGNIEKRLETAISIIDKI